MIAWFLPIVTYLIIAQQLPGSIYIPICSGWLWWQSWQTISPHIRMKWLYLPLFIGLFYTFHIDFTNPFTLTSPWIIFIGLTLLPITSLWVPSRTMISCLITTVTTLSFIRFLLWVLAALFTSLGIPAIKWIFEPEISRIIIVMAWTFGILLCQKTPAIPEHLERFMQRLSWYTMILVFQPFLLLYAGSYLTKMLLGATIPPLNTLTIMPVVLTEWALWFFSIELWNIDNPWRSYAKYSTLLTRCIMIPLCLYAPYQQTLHMSAPLWSINSLSPIILTGSVAIAQILFCLKIYGKDRIYQHGQTVLVILLAFTCLITRYVFPYINPFTHHNIPTTVLDHAYQDALSSMAKNKVKWISSKQGSHRICQGMMRYSGRTFPVPGRIAKKHCLISYARHIQYTIPFKVLNLHQHDILWEKTPIKDANNQIIGGYEPTSGTLVGICRYAIKGHWVIGKYSKQACHIVQDHTEKELSIPYEIALFIH